MRKSLLIYIFVLVTLNSTGATFTLTPGYQKAYEEILRLRFNSASSIIDAEKKANPGNSAWCYLEAYEDFLKVIISEQETDYANLVARKSSRIKILSSISSKSPWLLYTQAQLNLQEGIAAVKNGNPVKAAKDINRAYSQFDKNNKLFPDFTPNKAGLGLLHVLLGSIPDSYKWIPGLLGMEGNIIKGTQMFHHIIIDKGTFDNQRFLYDECLFITTFITFNLAETDENILLLQKTIHDTQINSHIKKSPLLIYAVSSYYLHQGQNDKALELLLNRPVDRSYFNFSYLDYLTGIALLNKLDPKASIYFLKYTSNFRGKYFIKSAYQRLAWSCLIRYDTAGYHKYISRALTISTSETDNDKEALREAQQKSIPDINLLRARLLFDGGYYSSAMQLLKDYSNKSLSTERRVEYYYRLARIYHKQKNIAKAKEYYHTTYKSGRGLTTYYAANSILNIGLLYEEEGKLNEAASCYMECLKMNFKEYKTSIQQKAKAGLNRVKRS